jgi:hypothetical protein
VPRIRPPITPEQCRRARVLLDWTWSDIAAADGAEGAVAVAANKLEAGYDLDHGQLVAIRRVFEAAGIEFLPDGTVCHREPAR